MRKTHIYDLPTRIFHWLFATLFMGSFFIAKTIDDESSLFSYHMLGGLILAFLVGIRIIWGILGTKYARFSSFALHPSDLLFYFKGILTGARENWPGHNPASSWAAILMLAFAAGLGITGVFMTAGQKEAFEDAHELLANGFLLTVIVHISGVLIHSIRYKDGIALSMIHGKKQTEIDIEPNNVPRPFVTITFVLLIMIFSGYLVHNYNTQNGKLNLFGIVLTLKE